MNQAVVAPKRYYSLPLVELNLDLLRVNEARGIIEDYVARQKALKAADLDPARAYFTSLLSPNVYRHGSTVGISTMASVQGPLADEHRTRGKGLVEQSVTAAELFLDQERMHLTFRTFPHPEIEIDLEALIERLKALQVQQETANTHPSS